MMKFEQKVEPELGPAMSVSLPKDAHKTLSDLAEYTGFKPNKIVVGILCEELKGQREKDKAFAKWLLDRRAISAALGPSIEPDKKKGRRRLATTPPLEQAGD